MSIRIVLSFETSDEALLALEYIGQKDAPVMVDPLSYVEVGEHRFQLWGDFGDAENALTYPEDYLDKLREEWPQ